MAHIVLELFLLGALCQLNNLGLGHISYNTSLDGLRGLVEVLGFLGRQIVVLDPGLTSMSVKLWSLLG